MSHGVARASYSGVKTAARILGCTEADLLKTDCTQHVRVYDAEDDSQWPEWINQKIAGKKQRLENRLIKAG
jgi:hypothetical protein